MSLSEIKASEAKNNPINHFYVNTLDVKSLTADELDISGDLIVDGTIVTNSVRSEPGSNLALLPGTVPGNSVTITAPALFGASIAANGIAYLSGNNVTTTAMTNGQIPIGRTGLSPIMGTLTAGQGITVTNASGSISLSRLPLVAITSVTTTSIADSSFTTINYTNLNTIYDPYGFKTSNSEFTVPVGLTGKYWIAAGCRFADSKAGTSRGITILLNNAPIDPMGWFTADTVGMGRNSATLSYAITLPAGAVVTVGAWQDTGGPLDVTSSQLSLECLYLGV